MHFKTKSKLKTATKLFTTEPENGKVTDIKVKLPNDEYVEFNLSLPFPTKVKYLSSKNNKGFDYNVETDIPIFHRKLKEVKKSIKNSIGYQNNNQKTIEDLIQLIDTMSPHI